MLSHSHTWIFLKLGMKIGFVVVVVFGKSSPNLGVGLYSRFEFFLFFGSQTRGVGLYSGRLISEIIRYFSKMNGVLKSAALDLFEAKYIDLDKDSDPLASFRAH